MEFKFNKIDEWREFYGFSSDVCPTARYFKVEYDVLIPTAIILLPKEHVNDNRFVSEFLYTLAADFEGAAEEEAGDTNPNDKE